MLIRGTDSQITQIRDLLTKLGEHFESGDSVQSGHVRNLPIGEGAARTALERIKEVWPTMRRNEIIVKVPADTDAASGAVEPRTELPAPRHDSGRSQGAMRAPERSDGRRDESRRTLPLLDLRPADPPKDPEEKLLPPTREAPKPAPAAKVTTTAPARPGKLFGARILLVADPVPAKPAPESKSPAETGQAGKPDTGAPGIPSKPGVQPPARAAPGTKPPAPIFVIPGPNCLTIISDDLDALDEFERLLTTAAEGSGGPMAVFYLKYAKAEAVAAELEKILSGMSDSDGSADKGSPAVSRRVLSTGTIKITPETRLNALLVLANRADQNTIEQLLKILDREKSPEEIAVSPKPRMIPVEHARAKDIADVVRQVYADRMVTAPQDQQQGGRGGFLRAMMGGMGPGGPFGGGPGGPGGGQGGQSQRDTANRISVGVDTRTNNLIVSATDAMFEEVKQLVQQLDEASAQNETVRWIPVHHTSATAVEKVLATFAGDSVQTSSTSTPGAGGNNANGAAQPWWMNRGGGGAPGGQPSMGSPFGGGFGGGGFGGGGSPFQGGFGGGRRSRFMQQQGAPGQ